jgi:hypothetical protein
MQFGFLHITWWSNRGKQGCAPHCHAQQTCPQATYVVATALRKLRSTLRYRRLLRLPVRQRLRLLRKRLGLP